MKVLVSAASRHGATTEVAKAIAVALSTAGMDADVIPPAEVTSLDGFDAAVIGSAVYVGRWLEPARDLVERHRDAFTSIPVWLFSSGPIGDPPKPIEDPIEAPALRALVAAREHRVFPGEIDKKRLGLGERAILAAVRAPAGDFRPWSEIDAWALEIAAALSEDRRPVTAR
jgi:menaquinone-dependent protoporphyrinogen oxidase